MTTNVENEELELNTEPELNIEIGPNWFASVMGTGIIANAAVGLPMVGQHLEQAGLVIWVIALSLIHTPSPRD